ncbi:hypothetical protein NQ315_005704 [Exocentrus adspersus]|uniref:DDE Tnp4 domain-containing protein n=2 Tax=Exocentrus adspersus TaxID=1586481 RepID=A0AAV8VHU9_9CUCU|nr:hypothetical protein NQ315_005704 [Exocentrus adspersus]
MEELIGIQGIQNVEIAEILNNRQGNRRANLNRRQDPFEILNERMFIKVFRFSKQLVRDLLQILDPYIQGPSRDSALDKQAKVLVALNFFGNGCYQTNIGLNEFCGVSQSSVSRCIKEIANALNEQAIFNTWIHFPRNRREMDTIRLRFYDKYGLPGVIGAIDCTHVAIFPPSQNDEVYPEHIYVNRKNYHSLNVQLVCDDQLRITNINARFPGSTHDAYIWSHSNVSEAVSNFNRQNPSYYLIGDSGYPLRPWLQTPIRDPPPGTPEYAYNTSFKRARSTVERCNGLLKMRFRCLLKHRVLHYAPSMCSKIINSCAVLHNMCLAANIPIPEEEGNENVDFGIIQEDLEPANPNRARQNPDLVRGRNIQQQVIQNYFISLL